MVKKEIVLQYVISSNGIDVVNAKIDLIANVLPLA